MNFIFSFYLGPRGLWSRLLDSWRCELFSGGDDAIAKNWVFFMDIGMTFPHVDKWNNACLSRSCTALRNTFSRQVVKNEQCRELVRPFFVPRKARDPYGSAIYSHLHRIVILAQRRIPTLCIARTHQLCHQAARSEFEGQAVAVCTLQHHKYSRLIANSRSCHGGAQRRISFICNLRASPRSPLPAVCPF